MINKGCCSCLRRWIVALELHQLSRINMSDESVERFCSTSIQSRYVSSFWSLAKCSTTQDSAFCYRSDQSRHHAILRCGRALYCIQQKAGRRLTAANTSHSAVTSTEPLSLSFPNHILPLPTPSVSPPSIFTCPSCLTAGASSTLHHPAISRGARTISSPFFVRASRHPPQHLDPREM